MEAIIKVGGLTRRWTWNVLAVMICVVTAIVVLFSLLITTSYRDSLVVSAEGLTKSFEKLAVVDRSEFYTRARQTAEAFEHKDKLEIQIINANGTVIVSTNGFAPTVTEMPDYQSAIKAATGTATWTGESANGENVMAQTTILPDFGAGSNGAVRWVVSLDPLNRQLFILILIAVAVGIVIVAISFALGTYFIRSIVRPVQEVSKTARKIAMGDLSVRLQVKESNEIGELCDTINYMASELGRAESIKNDFISSVSHELRTPLTAIKGWGETVKLSVGTDDDIVARGTDIILNEADRLSGLVEELLDFSRIQSGRLTLHMSWENILHILREAVFMYKEVARQNGIELEYAEDKTLVNAFVDKNRIKQVFINVIDNAVKYTQSGGKVTVSTTLEQGCVRINVQDTGVGIKAKDLDHVKEKFYKANNTIRGSGIGLAVADEIIKQHKGLLFLESTEGVGTLVTIVLSIQEDQPEEPEKETV